MTIVEVNCGKIKGYTENNLQIFKGIPYAEPPIGDLRFSPPQTKKPWDGVLETTEFGPCAYQGYTALEDVTGKLQPESEDCLTLNIWTPAIDNQKRPVMFWLHGGAFIFGGSRTPTYNGSELVQRGDVVIVSINYRLGALGYLFIPGVTANVGLLDQILALKWVQDNIAKFGGDPDNITIFGESAGAYSVIVLTAMPAAKGLFRRIIAQSMVTIDLRVKKKPTKELMRALGIKSGDINALREVAPEEIIKAQNEITKRNLGAFSPTIDGDTIPVHPLTVFKEGKCKNIDLMMGTNLHEAKLFTSFNPQTSNIKDEKGIMLYLGMMGINSENAKNIIDTYKEARAGIYSIEPKELLDSIITDLMFRVATLQILEAQSIHQPNTYNYLFTWETPLYNGRLGACHSLELPFIFNTLEDSTMKAFVGNAPNTEDLCKNMMDVWLSFAHKGNPNHDGIPHWPSYDKNSRATFLFGKDFKVANALFEKERVAWDGILKL
ncbi:MAG: carboxylesterase/lipase family protein [Candidatus Odinarchaeota archaeon]